jgi:hypothetical protein
MVADQASRHATTMLPGTGSAARPAGPGKEDLEFFGRRNTADEGLPSSLTLITGFAVLPPSAARWPSASGSCSPAAGSTP